MSRITLVFRLSTLEVQQDLVREFSLHHGVDVIASVTDGAPVLTVDVTDAASSVWDVRATVGMYDDRASEIRDQG